MKAIHPHLDFPGTAEQAFAPDRSVFGGEFSACQRYRDMPGDACPGGMKPADGNRILHIFPPLANGTMLMASDRVDGMGQPPRMGDHASICLDVGSAEEADRLFDVQWIGNFAKPGPR